MLPTVHIYYCSFPGKCQPTKTPWIQHRFIQTAKRHEEVRHKKHFNKKFLEVQKPFFKKVFGRRRQNQVVDLGGHCFIIEDKIPLYRRVFQLEIVKHIENSKHQAKQEQPEYDQVPEEQEERKKNQEQRHDK
jgi:hypothetical protein